MGGEFIINSWITCNGKKVLWLPPDYRPCFVTVKERMIAMGTRTGLVLVIGFASDIRISSL